MKRKNKIKTNSYTQHISFIIFYSLYVCGAFYRVKFLLKESHSVLCVHYYFKFVVASAQENQPFSSNYWNETRAKKNTKNKLT